MSTCSICMDTLGAVSSRREVSQLVATKCRHVYHERCLREWMKRSQTCPECKAEQKGKLVRLKPEVQSLEDHLLPHDSDTVERVENEVADIEEANEKLRECIEVVSSAIEDLEEECQTGQMELGRTLEAAQKAKRLRQTAEEKVYTVELDMQVKLEELRKAQSAVREDMTVREPKPGMKVLRDNIVSNRNIDALMKAVELEWQQLLESYRRPEEDLEIFKAEINAIDEELREARAKCRSPIARRKRAGGTRAHERVLRIGHERQLLTRTKDQTVLERMRSLAGGGDTGKCQSETMPSNTVPQLQRQATRIVGFASQCSEVSQSVTALPKLRRTATEVTVSSEESCPLEELLGDLMQAREEDRPPMVAPVARKARTPPGASSSDSVGGEVCTFMDGGSSCSYLPEIRAKPSVSAVVELSSDSDVDATAPRPPAKQAPKRRRVGVAGGGRGGGKQCQITQFFTSATSGG